MVLQRAIVGAGVVQLLQNSIQRQLGHDQIQALEKLRGDVSDPEKLLDAEGPTVMGTSRSMERGFRDLAICSSSSSSSTSRLGR